MKVLVTGAAGMLAREVVAALTARDHEVVALDRAALDVTREAAVRERIRRERPDAVVQCAAYTAVDAAEADPDTAHALNAEAAGFVARACQEIGASLVYPSTDYVFSGDSDRPYRPGDPTGPLSVYGRSKLEGERAVLGAPGGLVVRTSWLYGAGGPNFVETISRLAAERDELRVVMDQVGRPTWTRSLARAIVRLAEGRATGVFHATDQGDPVSWFDFAREIVALRGSRARVLPITTAEMPRPAARPKFSVLDCSATEIFLNCSLPRWQDSLAEYLSEASARPIPHALHR